MLRTDFMNILFEWAFIQINNELDILLSKQLLSQNENT